MGLLDAFLTSGLFVPICFGGILLCEILNERDEDER